MGNKAFRYARIKTKVALKGIEVDSQEIKATEVLMAVHDDLDDIHRAVDAIYQAVMEDNEEGDK